MGTLLLLIFSGLISFMLSLYLTESIWVSIPVSYLGVFLAGSIVCRVTCNRWNIFG